MWIKNREYVIIDTPGLHCLSIRSEEEIIVRNLLFKEKPDGIIQCINTNRLKQSLPLTLDLIELGIPMAISLNAIQESERLTIDSHKLSEILGIPVIEHNTALDRGAERLKTSLTEMKAGSLKSDYGIELETMIGRVQSLLPATTSFGRKKALLLLLGDEHLLRSLRNQYGESVGQQIRNTVDEMGKASRMNPGRALHARGSKTVDAIFESATEKEKHAPGSAGRTFAHLCRHPLSGIPILAFIILAAYFLVVNVAGFVQTVLTEIVVTPIVLYIRELIP